MLLLLGGATSASAQTAPMPPERASAQTALADPSTPAAPDASAAQAQRASLVAMLEAYAEGRVDVGDGLAAAWTGDPAALVVGEWLAIRAGAVRRFDRLAAFLRDNPDWPDVAIVRRRAEEALVREGLPAETVIGFFARGLPVTPGGTLTLARAFLAEDLAEDAEALVREAWRNETLGVSFETLFLLEHAQRLRPVDHRVRFERALFRGDWDAAGRVIAQLPQSGHRDLQALLAARRAVITRARNAERVLADLPERVARDPSALFSRLRFLRNEGRFAEAALLLSSAPREPGLVVDGDAWWTERRIVARSTLEAGDAARAYAIAANHAAQSASDIIDAEWTAGWIALRFLDAPDAAAGHFAAAAAHATMPISITRVAYWRARAAEAMGDARAAEGFYREAAAHPITFYGQLSLAALGETHLRLRAPTAPEEATRVASAETEIAADAGEVAAAADAATAPDEAAIREALDRIPAARAVALMEEAGLRERAIPLYAALGRTIDDPVLLAAIGDAAAAAGDARGLLALGRSAIYRGLPLDQHAFPTLGIPQFRSVAAEVPPALVYAIARQESAFHASARSHAGALGLMQLMPATAQRTASRFGLPHDVRRLTADPAFNATLGSAHLAELMEEWGGSYILVFAAYNAGGGHVRRWIDRFGDPRQGRVDPIDWIEQIPFPETRNYVMRVMENYQVYRARLEGDRPLTILEDLRRGRPR